MPQFRIRRPWTIAPRREEDDGEEQRQRRLLDRELERWRQQVPARPQPEEEGPIRLGRLGQGIARKAQAGRELVQRQGLAPGRVPQPQPQVTPEPPAVGPLRIPRLFGRGAIAAQEQAFRGVNPMGLPTQFGRLAGLAGLEPAVLQEVARFAEMQRQRPAFAGRILGAEPSLEDVRSIVESGDASPAEKQAIWELYQQRQAARREGATALGPIDLPFALAGMGAERGVEALG